MLILYFDFAQGVIIKKCVRVEFDIKSVLISHQNFFK